MHVTRTIGVSSSRADRRTMTLAGAFFLPLACSKDFKELSQLDIFLQILELTGDNLEDLRFQVSKKTKGVKISRIPITSIYDILFWTC